MGVTDIELVDGEWDRRKYSPFEASEIWTIPLHDDYEFTLNRFMVE